MSAILPQPPSMVDLSGDQALSRDVAAHLEVQLESARRLLAIVLEQGAAIRAREVHAVVAAAGQMRAELERRKVLELERSNLLERAGVRLGIDPGAVTLEPLCRLMDPDIAAIARQRSAELRGRLREIRREHHTNRALMTQHLAFLDHLMNLADIGNANGYDASGDRARLASMRTMTGHRLLDLEVYVAIPTLTGFNTALSGLEAMQAGLDTTSNNISNASNPDYADEIVNFGETPDYLEQDGGITSVAVGTGATVENVEREDNPFLDAQYYQANAASSNSSTVYNQLSNLESDLDTSSSTGNLGSAMGSFFSAWNSLSTASGSGTAQAVISTGTTVAEQLNSLSSEVSTLQQQAGDQLTALTGTGGQVQTYTNEIAQYNTEISQATASGQSANSLEDQRATAIDGLSSLLSLNVSQQSDGSVTITLNNGTTPPPALITGGTVTLPTSYSAADGGEIGALAALSDTNAADSDAPLAQLQQGLDGVAQALNTAVNTALGGTTSFFSASTGATDPITAANIEVNPAMTAATVQATSASTAEDVFNAESQATDSYSSFVTQVGDTVDGAQDADSTNQALLTQVSNQRQSVSGVSLDQEMTNLISYQQGYEASAKVMSTMQSVIETLINTVGSGGV